MAKITVLDNVNVQIKDVPPDIRRKCSDNFKEFVPTAKYSPQFQHGYWDGYEHFFDAVSGRTYLSILPDVVKFLLNNNVNITEIDDKRTTNKVSAFNFRIDENYLKDKGIKWPEGHNHEGEFIEVRDYQVTCINKFLETPRAIEEVCTSAGKTIITAILAMVVEDNLKQRTITIVPSKSLVTQTAEDFNVCGLDVGIYYQDKKETTNQHIITTWQSLGNLIKSKKADDIEALDNITSNIGAVILDECHNGKAATIKKILSGKLAYVGYRWGLTGTIPKEKHAKQILKCCLGEVIHKLEAKELQDRGFLSTCNIRIIQTKDDKHYAEWTDEKKFLCSDEQRLDLTVKLSTSLGKLGNTLVLVNQVQQAKYIFEKLKELDMSVSLVHGVVKNQDRIDVYKSIQTADNEIIVATYGVASTGINIPRLFNMLVIDAGKSFTRVIQTIGRGIRKAKDKDHINIYDLCSDCKYSSKHVKTRMEYYKEKKYPYVLEKLDYRK